MNVLGIKTVVFCRIIICKRGAGVEDGVEVVMVGWAGALCTEAAKDKLRKTLEAVVGLFCRKAM